MAGLFVTLTWIIGIILGVMWLFLPWIIISKLDQVVEELKKLNSRKNAE